MATGIVSNRERWTEFLGRYYRDEINLLSLGQVDKQKSLHLPVDFRDIVNFDVRLSEELLNNPGKVLKDAEDALPLVLTALGKPVTAFVRAIKLPRKTLIRELRSDHVNGLVGLDCTVKKITYVRPRIINAAFECARCGDIVYISQEGSGKFLEPSYCRCNEEKKGVFRLLLKPTESTYVDHQKIRVQESQAGLRGGEQPQAIDVHLYNDIAGMLGPGQHVIINGIVRAVQHITKDGKTVDFDVYVDANSLELDADNLEKLSISPAEEEAIKKIATGDPYRSFQRSIAPTIIGYEMEKLAVSLQMVGGVTKEMPDGTRIRGDINNLWVGDPGISKTQILKFVTKTHPRAMYVNAKNSTPAGLTGAAVKDNFGEQSWTIEAGALVLADTGIACIDELDKTSVEVQGSLLEAMEQQTVSKAAAGITTTMMARTSVLAAANPKDGRVDPEKTFLEQVNIILPLWQRFDLTFLTPDTPDKKRDGEIAEHVLDVHIAGELYMSGSKDNEKIKNVIPEIEPELLRKYVAYARPIIPVMGDEVEELLKNFYVDSRCRPGSSASIRMLESLVRYSEASAKLRLSTRVEESDAERAIMLMEYSMKQTCRDPETGRIDPEILNIGESHSMKDHRTRLKAILEELKHDHLDGIPLDIVKEKAAEHGLPEKRVGDYLRKMKTIGEAYEPKTGHYLPC